MSDRYSVPFVLYGLATVEAGSESEAVHVVSDELLGWSGTGTVLDVEPNGTDIEGDHIVLEEPKVRVDVQAPRYEEDF